MQRISKENYYLNIAQTVLERATCLRRVYGAIIVKNDEIISTGYNGAPRGRRNCVDMGYCTRERLQVPRGERYELCRSVHAEANAIISASRRHPVPGGPQRPDRGAAAGRHLLPHVPPPHHQRGPGAGGDPPHSHGVSGGGRAGLDRQRGRRAPGVRQNGNSPAYAGKIYGTKGNCDHVGREKRGGILYHPA